MICDEEFARFSLIPMGRSYRQLGQTNSSLPGSLAFLDTRRFIDDLVCNPNVEGVIVCEEFVEEISGKRPDLALYPHPDPRLPFFTLHNEIARATKLTVPTVVHPDADVHPAAHVAEHNVIVGKGTRIAPGAIILQDVEIGENCIVQAGAVVGSEGFEYKRTQSGLLPVEHDGKVIIGDHVEIGANSCIDKGFSGRPTVLKNDCKIDNLVYIAHSVTVGEGALLASGTSIAGSCKIGAKAWLSVGCSIAPGLTVGDEAFVSIGAVVTRDVEPRTQVTGNFAVPHKQFLQAFRRWLRY